MRDQQGGRNIGGSGACSSSAASFLLTEGISRDLTQSLEGATSNILVDRLRRLVRLGLIVTSQNPGHKQKAIYSLREKGIELLLVR